MGRSASRAGHIVVAAAAALMMVKTTIAAEPPGTESGDQGQQTTPTGQTTPAGQTTPTGNERDRAERELNQQKKQRILGIIPNFNTSNVPDAAPLSAEQKFRLALRGAVDPFAFLAAGMVAGLEQWENGYSGYGQGLQRRHVRRCHLPGSFASGPTVLPQRHGQLPQPVFLCHLHGGKDEE
jgi:hypothetical protein